MMKILILEDNADRRAEMQCCLRDRFHQFETVFFADANEMTAYLESNLKDAMVISLDHDLELIDARQNGEMHDCGTGRIVANYLAKKSPVCPVLIATTNSACGDGMEFALRDANWETYRVYP